MNWLYSLTVSNIVNFGFGAIFYYEVIYWLFSMEGWYPHDKKSYSFPIFIFVVLLLMLCIEYNYNRYVYKVKEWLGSKVIFWFTTLFQLFSYTVFAILYSFYHK